MLPIELEKANSIRRCKHIFDFNRFQFDTVFLSLVTNRRLNMDWEALVRIEPRLATLLREVEAADTGEKRSFCGVTAWHGSGGRPGFKIRAFRLVGFGCSNPELRSRDAYETALEKLCAAFPPCRGCACLAEEELEACA
jgi:hypothetical protein